MLFDKHSAIWGADKVTLYSRVASLTVVVAAVFSFISLTLVFPELALSEVKSEGAKRVVVTSDTMESLRAEGVVIFRGSVVAEQDHLMCSDELRVFYNDMQQVKDIVATGDVRIVHEGKRARGDKVVYDKAADTFVITGNAAAVQCGDIVRGEKIIIHLDTNNVFVEGGTGRVRAVITPQSKTGSNEKEKKDCSEGTISEEFQCQRAR
jgi:lipopolysaccharide transport protein LptA